MLGLGENCVRVMYLQGFLGPCGHVGSLVGRGKEKK